MNRVSLLTDRGGRAEGGACDGGNRTHALFKQSLCPPFSGLAEVMNANENRLGLFPFEEFLERLVLLQKHHSEEEKCGLCIFFSWSEDVHLSRRYRPDASGLRRTDADIVPPTGLIQPDRTPSIRGPETARSPQWCRRAALRVTSRRRACDSARQLSSSSQSRYCVELLASPRAAQGFRDATRSPKTWDFISEHGVWSFLPDPRAMRQ